MKPETTQNIMEPNGELLSRATSKDISGATSEDMLNLISGDFEYTKEIRSKALCIINKVMEVEKNMVEQKIRGKINIKADKIDEFNKLDSNYIRNMLSRYEVYENLSADEVEFIEKYKNNILALKNIIKMHNEAKNYMIEEAEIEVNSAAA